MAQHGAGSGREHGGHPAPLAREHPMADRVHAAVPHVQLSGPDSPRNRAARQAERDKLPRGYDPVLAVGQRRDRSRLQFVPHIDTNCRLDRHPARLPGQFARECDGLHQMSDIPHRELGRSGLRVSVLGLGSWLTFERLARDTGVAIMRAAQAAGITFLDDARYNDATGTAPLASGYSEVVFGELFRAAAGSATRHRRQQAVVRVLARTDRRRGARRFAQRMGSTMSTSSTPNGRPPTLPLDELFEQVSGLIQAGKARAWGVLNWPPGQIAEVEKIADPPPCAAQLPYSLVRREWVENAEMDRTEVSVVASAVLAGGALTGKYPGPGRLAARLDDPVIAEAVMAAPGPAEAIRFALAHPRVASAVVGATTPAQVAENVRAVA